MMQHDLMMQGGGFIPAWFLLQLPKIQAVSVHSSTEVVVISISKGPAAACQPHDSPFDVFSG